MEVNYFARPKLVRYETVEIDDLDDLVPLALVRDVADKAAADAYNAMFPDELEFNEEDYETFLATIQAQSDVLEMDCTQEEYDTFLASIQAAQLRADQVGIYDYEGLFPDFPQIQIQDIIQEVFQPPAPLLTYPPLSKKCPCTPFAPLHAK